MATDEAKLDGEDGDAATSDTGGDTSAWQPPKSDESHETSDDHDLAEGHRFGWDAAFRPLVSAKNDAAGRIEEDEDMHQVQPPPTLPRTVSGGLVGIATDLDRQGRDRSVMVRLLAQQSLLLEASEGERNRLIAELSKAAPRARETARALEVALASTKAGDVSTNLAGLFAANLTALNELESVASALTANALLMRSTWEQYARSALTAHKMREDAGGG